jgi:hypothetical protein
MYAVCDGEVVSDWLMVIAGNGMNENEIGFVMTKYSFVKILVNIVNLDVVAV